MRFDNAMRLVVLGASAVLAGCGGDKAAPTGAAGCALPLCADVFMPNISTYSPFQTDINRTGTVRFNFPAEAHNVIFTTTAPGTPADIPVLSNTVVSRQFNTVGSFPFYCTLHPQMVGSVVVH